MGKTDRRIGERLALVTAGPFSLCQEGYLSGQHQGNLSGAAIHDVVGRWVYLILLVNL